MFWAENGPKRGYISTVNECGDAPLGRRPSYAWPNRTMRLNRSPRYPMCGTPQVFIVMHNYWRNSEKLYNYA